MNELQNIANVTGTYNNIPTAITSNASVVNVIEGLTLTKNADKENWVDGYLTYTLVLDNQADETYTTPTITDVIDNTYAKFVADSVTIDNVKATTSQYSYDDANHKLTITLTDLAPSSSVTVKFMVEKNN